MRDAIRAHQLANQKVIRGGAMTAASLSLGAHTRAVASRAFLRPIGGAEPVEQRADRSACSLPVHHEAWRCAEQPAVLLGGGVSEKLEGARL